MGIKRTNKTKTSNDSSYREVRSLISLRFQSIIDFFFSSRAKRISTALFAFSFSFFVSLLAASHFMPVDKGDAVNGTYYTSITSSGNVGINVISTPDGSIEVGKDSLSISTNATNGYKLYISTVSGATGNGLYGSGGGAGSFISPSSGSSSSPVALSTNTWGYVASRNSNNGSSIVNNATSTTGNLLGVSDELSGNGTGSFESSTTGGITTRTYTKDSAIFAAVPTYGNEDVLYTNSTPSTSSTNSVDVYYGVNATTALPSGTYTNSVVYTAITDASNPSSATNPGGLTITPSSQDGYQSIFSTNVTIDTSIYPDDGVDLSDLGINVNIGSNSCTNVSLSIGTNGNLVITCNTPAQSSTGTYDVSVTVNKYNDNNPYVLTNGYTYNTKYYTATISLAGSGLNRSAASVSVPYGSSSTVTITPSSGYKITGASCTNSYSVSPSANNQTSATTFTITNPSSTNGTTCTFTGAAAYEGYMQDFTTASCTAMSTGASKTLRDSRDSKDYTIAKLADGKCWMTQDLKFESGSLTLNSSNSNIPSGSFTIGSENTGRWCTDTNDTCYKTKNWIKTGVPNGYLYNWYTATAGTNNVGYNTNSPTGDICPKGWQLPSGGSSGDFVNLVKAYGGSGSTETNTTVRDKLLASPISMNYTGYRNGGSTSSTTTRAYYWSRTVKDSSGAYDLLFGSSGTLYPQSGDNKYYGVAIRCMAK